MQLRLSTTDTLSKYCVSTPVYTMKILKNISNIFFLAIKIYEMYDKIKYLRTES